MNGAIKKVRKTSGKTADVNMLKRLGPWIKDSLLLIDLGYFFYVTVRPPKTKSQ